MSSGPSERMSPETPSIVAMSYLQAALDASQHERAHLSMQLEALCAELATVREGVTSKLHLDMAAVLDPKMREMSAVLDRAQKAEARAEAAETALATVRETCRKMTDAAEQALAREAAWRGDFDAERKRADAAEYKLGAVTRERDELLSKLGPDGTHPGVAWQRMNAELVAAEARALDAEAAVVRLREAIEDSVIETRGNLTRCTVCLAETYTVGASPCHLPHCPGAALDATTPDLATTQRREWEARGIEEAAGIVNAEMQSEAVSRDRAYAAGRANVGSHRQAGVESLEGALTRLRTLATQKRQGGGT